MSPETAHAVVIAIASILIVAWVAALLTMVLATRAAGSSGDHDGGGRYEIEDSPARNTIVGDVEVDGSPETVSAKLRSVLSRGEYTPFGTVEIVPGNRHEVIFKTSRADSQRKQGRLRLSSVGNRTRIDYAIEAPSGRGLLALGWIFVALGLAALAALAWLEFRFVLPSPNSRTRIQSVQMIQAVHFIWPPFLFAYLSRRTGCHARYAIDELARQLPYA